MLKKFLLKRKNQAVGLFVLLILAAAFLFLPSQIIAQDVGLDYASNIGLTPASDSDIRVFIVNIVKYLLTFIGIIAVGMIMYSGFLWMTSEGSPDKVEKAKKTLINSSIGLLIIISAFAIVSFIANLIIGGLSSTNTGPGTKPVDPGRGYGSIGACTVESVYPEPNQEDVPRNTSFTITFKEVVNPQNICGLAACANNPILPENIHLFVTNSGDGCNDDPSDCARNITNVNVSSSDNMTFVFTPVNYLGSPSEYIWHTVYVSNNITKLSDGSGIFDTCARDYLEWQFQVSNKLDLTPPQVEENGVFPGPDNLQDNTTIISAESATGNFIVLSQPSAHTLATFGALIPQGTSPTASLSNQNFELQQSGTLSMSVNTTATYVVLSNGSINLGQAAISNNTATFPGFFTLNIDETPDPGNEWTVAVTSSVTGNRITVGIVNYVFGDDINVGADINVTANNIANVINVHPDISAVVSANQINITAVVPGIAGNNILLSSSNVNAVSVTPMSGGVPEGLNTIVADVKDKPRNAIIQINFNEAINPLTVSGDAADVSNHIKVIDIDNDPGGYLAGKFVVSNQYKTVEFIPDNLCGTNACGESIYCLPANTNIRVELVAASLATCPGEIDCATKSPYVNCVGGHCQNDTGVNYPMSTTPPNGVIDMALNSLDGDRSGDAIGPVFYFDENNPIAGNGDNYQWSFYISGIIDLGAPIILSTGPTNDEDDTNLSNPVTATFDELMLSSSLKTGSTKIYNGQEYYEHKLINIWNFTGGALGYWISKTNLDVNPIDGEPDRTEVQIIHSQFKEATSYRTQIGSGVKDIYQNCFKPSEGPACAGAINDANPTCCSGTASTEETCP